MRAGVENKGKPWDAQKVLHRSSGASFLSWVSYLFLLLAVRRPPAAPTRFSAGAKDGFVCELSIVETALTAQTLRNLERRLPAKALRRADLYTIYTERARLMVAT